MSKLLNKYIEEATKAKKELSDKLGHPIEDLDFQFALASHFGYSDEDSIRVMNHKLTAAKMVEILESYDWKFPDEIEEVIMVDSILPDGITIRLDEQKVKNKGEIWVIHKNDKDPLPSNPHAHNYQNGYKLHLGNGQLFDKKNKDLGAKISNKDLEAIRAKIKNITLPPLSSI